MQIQRIDSIPISGNVPKLKYTKLTSEGSEETQLFFLIFQWHAILQSTSFCFSPEIVIFLQLNSYLDRLLFVCGRIICAQGDQRISSGKDFLHFDIKNQEVQSQKLGLNLNNKINLISENLRSWTKSSHSCSRLSHVSETKKSAFRWQKLRRLPSQIF